MRRRRQGRCVHEVRQAGGGRGARRQAAWLARCKSAVSQCEATIGCGKGIRPLRTVQQIFTQSCALSSCHSSITRQGGLVLDEEDVSYTRARQPARRRGPSGRRWSSRGPGRQLPDQEAEGTALGGDQHAAGWRAAVQGHHQADRAVDQPRRADDGAGVPARRQLDQAPARPQVLQRPTAARRHVRLAAEPALPPPSSEGASGIQFYTPPLDVAPGKEWEKCYAFKGVDWPRIAASSDMRRERCPSSSGRPTACTRAATTCWSTPTSASTRSTGPTATSLASRRSASRPTRTIVLRTPAARLHATDRRHAGGRDALRGQVPRGSRHPGAQPRHGDDRQPALHQPVPAAAADLRRVVAEHLLLQARTSSKCSSTASSRSTQRSLRRAVHQRGPSPGSGSRATSCPRSRPSTPRSSSSSATCTNAPRCSRSTTCATGPARRPGALCGRDEDCACSPVRPPASPGRCACEVRQHATRPSTTPRRGIRPRWWTTRSRTSR